MKRKKLLIGILVFGLLVLSGFGLWQLGRNALQIFVAQETAPTVPARLVSRVDVADYPVDLESARTYSSQYDVTRLLHLLRRIPAEAADAEIPSLEDAAYFTCFTITYANGSKGIWYLLEDQFICSDDETWYQADPTFVVQFHDFLESYPGDGHPATEIDPSPATATTEI